MAFPVLESSSQVGAATDANTIVITAPSGIDENDILVMFAGYYDTGGDTITFSTPAGWTLLHKKDSADTGYACFYKVALVADESAANYTVTLSANANRRAGSIHRISGSVPSAPILVSEIDNEVSPTGASPSYTTALTPLSTDSLVVMFFYGNDSTLASLPTIGSYATTPSATYTERADTGAFSGGEGITIGVASAEYSGFSTITNRTATFSQTMDRDRGGIILLVNSVQNASGENTLVETDTVVFPQTGTVDTNGTNVLVEATAEVFTQSGRGETPTQWSNEDKPSTTWTNLDK